MVDSVSTPEPIGAPPSEPNPPRRPGFLSTSTGKLIVGGVIVFVIVLAAGIFLFFYLVSNVEKAPVVVTTSLPPSTTTTQPAGVITEPPEQRLDDTFTFRNVFAPSVKIPVTPTTTSGGTGSGSTTTSDTSASQYPADTLVLTSIFSESGERVATFAWIGTVYTVH